MCWSAHARSNWLHVEWLPSLISSLHATCCSTPPWPRPCRTSISRMSSKEKICLHEREKHPPPALQSSPAEDEEEEGQQTGQSQPQGQGKASSSSSSEEESESESDAESGKRNWGESVLWLVGRYLLINAHYREAVVFMKTENHTGKKSKNSKWTYIKVKFRSRDELRVLSSYYYNIWEGSCI